jgi:hypothetical protein
MLKIKNFDGVEKQQKYLEKQLWQGFYPYEMPVREGKDK